MVYNILFGIWATISKKVKVIRFTIPPSLSRSFLSSQYTRIWKEKGEAVLFQSNYIQVLILTHAIYANKCRICSYQWNRPKYKMYLLPVIKVTAPHIILWRRKNNLVLKLFGLNSKFTNLHMEDDQFCSLLITPMTGNMAW